ncbi:hypothetical protein NE865_01853 [Phthorimaea operculella]|nr:hypothetical protein NE865_01853 [Phthorimaea operculella]
MDVKKVVGIFLTKSFEPDCPTAITPFHFLIGTSSNNHWLNEELDDSDLIRRCDWRRTLRLADAFWTRWMREYLPTLIPRPSSRGTKSRNLSVGDVVLVVDDSLPRGTWPLGKISKIHPGQDGVVRVVDVATQGGTLRRPARKVVLLTQGPQPAADAH